MVRDQPVPEGDQGGLGKRRSLGIRAVQYQLPAPVHHHLLDRLIVGAAAVGLHDRGQGQLCGGHGRLSGGGIGVPAGQLGLEVCGEQLVAVAAQPAEQLRPPHRPHDRLLGC
jgi:hypothetical protein